MSALASVCADAPALEIIDVNDIPDAQPDRHAEYYDFALALGECDVHYTKSLLSGLAHASANPEFARLLACAADALDA